MSIDYEATDGISTSLPLQDLGVITEERMERVRASGPGRQQQNIVFWIRQDPHAHEFIAAVVTCTQPALGQASQHPSLEVGEGCVLPLLTESFWERGSQFSLRV